MSVIIHWLHLMSAVLWVGGMLFVSFVIQPSLRGAMAPEQRLALYQEIGKRYRRWQWGCWAVLAATGFLKLATMENLTDFLGGRFGRILFVKLALVSAMVALSLLHAYVWGPRLVRLAPDHPDYAPLAARMSFWGRINALLVLLIVFCAALLVVGD